MMRLNYLTPNAAYAFTFGNDLLRMGDNDMFFATRKEAVAAAAQCRLKVSRRGVVTADGPGFCGCPSDCNCRLPYRTTYCGCQAHDDDRLLRSRTNGGCS
jgi:hypothetical protein